MAEASNFPSVIESSVSGCGKEEVSGERVRKFLYCGGNGVLLPII
jgi:hypothetical protein